VNDDINKLEPVAPVLTAFVKHAGDTSGRTADYAAYIADLEERTARTAAFQEQRRKQSEQASRPIDVVAELDNALTALEAGASDFENSFGKPNQPLIAAKLEVERLRGELAAAEDVLAKIEARGDSVQRLAAAVSSGENQLQALVSKAETAEILSKAHAHYGWDIPWDRISPEVKRDLKNHASVMAFKKFYVQRSIVNPGLQPSVDALQKQLDTVGRKLTELREHLANSTKDTRAS
jgi:hypothetical protein